MKKHAHTDLEKQFGSRREKLWNSTSECDNEGEKRVRKKIGLLLEIFHFSFDLLNFVNIYFVIFK